MNTAPLSTACRRKAFMMLKPFCWLVMFQAILFANLSTAPAQDSAADSNLDIENDYRIAAGFYSRSQWSDAISAFDQLISKHPKTRQARTALFFKGEAQIQQTRYRDSFKTFVKFIEQNTESPYLERAHFRRAESAFFSKKPSESIQYLSDFHKAYPDSKFNEFVMAYLGQSYLQDKKAADAIKAYEACLSRYPQSSLASKNQLGLAQSFQLQGNFPKAIQRFKQLIESSGPFQSSAMVGLGHLYFRQQNYADAGKAYQQFLSRYKNHPQQAVVQYWLGRSQMAQSNWTNAIATFQSIESKDLDSATASASRFDLAVCHIKANQWKRAEQDLRSLIKDWPKSKWADDAFAMLIELADRQKQSEQVILLVEKFKQAHPTSPLLRQSIESAGRIHYEQQEFAKSETIFHELLEESTPANPEQKNRWQYLLATSQIGQKKFAKAYENLESIPLKGNSPDFQADIAFAKATSAVGLKRLEQAEKNYNRYLEWKPNGTHSVLVIQDLIQLHCKNQQLEKATTRLNLLRLKADAPAERVASELAIADLAYLKKDYKTAETLYQLVVQNAETPDHQQKGWSGLFWVAQKLDKAKLKESSLAALMQNHAQEASSANAVLAAAKSAMSQGHDSSARRLLEWIEQHHSQKEITGNATIEMAILLRKDARPESIQRAEQLLENLIADRPTHPALDAAIYELAWLSVEQEKPQVAEQLFARVFTEFPESQFAADSVMRASTIAFERNDFGTAEKLSRKLISKKSKDRVRADHALLVHGRAQLAQDKFSEAQENLTYLLRSSADDKLRKSAAHYLSDAIIRSNSPEQAFELFCKKQKGFNPNAARLIPHVNLRVCQNLAEQGNLPLARKIAEKTEKRFRDFSQSYELDYIVGRALAETAQFSAARERYQRVLKSKSGKDSETAAKAQFMIGETHFHQEHFAEALNEYYKVDSLFAYDTWRAAGLLQAGKCQERLENLTQARKLYRQVIQLKPKSDYASQAKTRLEILSRQARKGSKRVR